MIMPLVPIRQQRISQVHLGSNSSPPIAPTKGPNLTLPANHAVREMLPIHERSPEEGPRLKCHSVQVKTSHLLT